MIVPSIDIMDGRAVQLRRGREQLLDGGDPLERLEEFAVAGEVAVIDLDAALGRGSNAPLVRELIRRAPCRVGGGIRDLETARSWLDAGAERVILGTAASPVLCGSLPRDRVVAAVDCDRGELMVDGWRSHTGRDVIAVIRELAPHTGGFLLTQIDREGCLAGFDAGLIERARIAARDARLTAAGGITTAAEIAALDRAGVDAQVGMALYSGSLSLADAVAAPLPAAHAWPTVVCDEAGVALGLAWSTPESLRRAIHERRGIYWSRSRDSLWIKGQTSGATQELLRVDLDCDRDAIRFLVRQHGAGFCHRPARTCWEDRFDLPTLERLIRSRAAGAPEGSVTGALLRDAALLRAKLSEEAAELSDAGTAAAAEHEAADLIYFTLTALARAGGSLEGVRAELARRSRRLNRRPMVAH